MADLVTPSHFRWAEFRARLDEAVRLFGCDGTVFAARNLLVAMGCDVEGSLDYFSREACSNCDCGILFGVGSQAEVEAACEDLGDADVVPLRGRRN